MSLLLWDWSIVSMSDLTASVVYTLFPENTMQFLASFCVMLERQKKSISFLMYVFSNSFKKENVFRKYLGLKMFTCQIISFYHQLFQSNSHFTTFSIHFTTLNVKLPHSWRLFKKFLQVLQPKFYEISSKLVKKVDLHKENILHVVEKEGKGCFLNL